jgi:hypothetical protein
VLNMQVGIRKLLLVGIGVILWVICLSRNDIVVDKSSVLSHMQVIYGGTHCVRMWSLFQKEEERKMLQQACSPLENCDNGNLRYT